MRKWDDEFPRARELWIPAFAGMTECFFGRWSSGTVDSRLRGNDGVFSGCVGVVGRWIPAFAGMVLG